MILKGLTWLVALQLLGSVIHLSLLPALPGPIIGLVLLFGLLLCRAGLLRMWGERFISMILSSIREHGFKHLSWLR